MIHLEIVGSSASPRADLLNSLGRLGFPGSAIYPPSLPSRRHHTSSIIRIPSSRRRSSNRRALQTTVTHADSATPGPEAADQDLPQSYIDAVKNAIVSCGSTPTSSGRSSPSNVETQSSLSMSQGGWTTGNITERSSLDSSCFSLDEFDRQAAITVSQHFEEFESMLFEGLKETRSNVYLECQEWVTQFPHLRLLGKQILAPCDTGFNIIAPTSSSNSSSSSTPRSSASDAVDLIQQDLSFGSNSQGLTLSGLKVKAVEVPLESSNSTSHDYNVDSNSEYNFLHEEVFAQDGVYEDIIAVDYTNIYEDNMEHKKQNTPRRRRVGFPPITPIACVKDSVLSAAFDSIWCEIISWMRQLLRKYAVELKSKKDGSGLVHVMVPAPAFRASSFVLQSRNSHVMDGQVSLDGMLNVSRMSLRNRNNLSMTPADGTESSILAMNQPSFGPVQRTSTIRPTTVNHAARWRQGQIRRLDPLPEPSKVQSPDAQPHPQNALHVKQIVPMSTHRLSSPPNPIAGRLPPLESSPSMLSHRKHSLRASSAVDNKEGRTLGAREKSNNAIEVNRPSTTQAFRSETPYGVNRRSSTPLGQNNSRLYFMSGYSKGLGIMGSSIQHPSSDPAQNILEDQEESPKEDIHHTQRIPSTPSYISHFKRMRTHRN